MSLRPAEPYFVHAEQSLVLGHHGVAWLGQDSHQRVFVQAVQRNDHGQAANELRDHPELDQVSGLDVLQQPVLLLDLCHRVRLTAAVGQVCSGSSAAPFPQVRGRSETQVLKVIKHSMRTEEGRANSKLTVAQRDLFVLPSADDSVQPVKSTRSHKQDVCCVHLHRFSSQFPGVFLRNVDNRALQEFEQPLRARRGVPLKQQHFPRRIPLF